MVIICFTAGDHEYPKVDSHWFYLQQHFRSPISVCACSDLSTLCPADSDGVLNMMTMVVMMTMMMY